MTNPFEDIIDKLLETHTSSEISQLLGELFLDVGQAQELAAEKGFTYTIQGIRKMCRESRVVAIKTKNGWTILRKSFENVLSRKR